MIIIVFSSYSIWYFFKSTYSFSHCNLAFFPPYVSLPSFMCLLLFKHSFHSLFHIVLFSQVHWGGANLPNYSICWFFLMTNYFLIHPRIHQGLLLLWKLPVDLFTEVLLIMSFPLFLPASLTITGPEWNCQAERSFLKLFQGPMGRLVLVLLSLRVGLCGSWFTSFPPD